MKVRMQIPVTDAEGQEEYLHQSRAGYNLLKYLSLLLPHPEKKFSSLSQMQRDYLVRTHVIRIDSSD